MKIAVLPGGKVLKFPDEVPDEAIDHAVKIHRSGQARQQQDMEAKEAAQKAEGSQRHDQVVQLLTVIAQLLQNLTQHSINEHQTIANNHKEATGAFDTLIKTMQTPKKRRLLRDDKGKTIGAEEYE